MLLKFISVLSIVYTLFSPVQFEHHTGNVIFAL